MNTWQTVLVAGGVLAVGAAVAAVVIHEKGRRREEDVFYKISPPEEAVLELKTHAGSFIGLYEPVCMVRDGELKMGKSVFADWDARVNNLEDAPSLAAFWNQAFGGFERWGESEASKKAGELLELTKAAGITRSEESEVTVDRSVFKWYDTLGGERIEPGARASVETPYWSMDGNVLEKGIISTGK